MGQQQQAVPIRGSLTEAQSWRPRLTSTSSNRCSARSPRECNRHARGKRYVVRDAWTIARSLLVGNGQIREYRRLLGRISVYFLLSEQRPHTARR